MLLGATMPAYQGIVATRCITPYFSNTAAQLMSRSMHIARDSITSLKLLIANRKCTQGGTEGGLGASATVTASIEYPAATLTQVLFSGSASGTIADGATLLSDACSVTIPKDATFFVRIHWTHADQFLFVVGSSALGDRISVGSSVADATMSGSVPDNIPGYCFPPVGIIGATQRRSALLIGTSRTAGVNDAFDSSGDLGILARSIGPGWGYINAGIAADTAVLFVSSHAMRVALADYVSDVCIDLGTNDNQSQLATLQANLATIAGYFPTKRVWLATASPATSGAWTLANGSDQSVLTDYGAFNTWVRTKPSPFFGVHDVAAVDAMPGTPTKWKADGTAAKWTSDGVHQSQYACLAIKYSGAVAI